MSRCIMVMSPGRGGSSAIAGILHKLGVCMGQEFVPADETNPFGTFEDRGFFDLTRRILRNDQDVSVDDYAPLVQERQKQSIWGLKDPALCHTAHYVWPLLEDCRLIRVIRPAHECINSYSRAYQKGRRNAMLWYDNIMRSLAARFLEWEGPVLDIYFRDLMTDPESQVRRVVDFAFEGMDPPNMEQFKAAVRHIRPPVHVLSHGPEPWGNIALGIRIHKHPHPIFYVDSLALVNRGLRNGDKLLFPGIGMPAHWAAQSAAQQFLLARPRMDTLLLMDDDHGFAPDVLHRLRENKANWEFDVAWPLIVRRAVQNPSPIQMWLRDKPVLPEALLGDSFEKPPPEIKLGEVQEQDAVGFGFTLIRRRVLEAMTDPEWGVEATYDGYFCYGPGRESDDIPFSRRCRELGFRMAIDSSVQVLHIADHALSYEDWVAFRAAEKVGRDDV